MITARTEAPALSPSPGRRVLQNPGFRPGADSALRVAVADGDADLLEAYQGLLGILGYETVSRSQTGRDLLINCRLQQPDLILLESKLPDADGLEVATLILKHRLIPIVLITPGPDSELLEQALRRGVLATVSKPFRLSELRAAIAHARRCFGQLAAVIQDGRSLINRRNHRPTDQ